MSDVEPVERDLADEIPSGVPPLPPGAVERAILEAKERELVAGLEACAEQIAALERGMRQQTAARQSLAGGLATVRELLGKNPDGSEPAAEVVLPVPADEGGEEPPTAEAIEGDRDEG